MKKEDRDYIMYLEDMLVSIKRVREYISDLDFEKFRLDSKTVDAVIRNFEIIGEASKNIPKEIKDNYNHMPWEEMYRLRNKASHEYFGIEHEIIWDIATRYLPKNQYDLEAILKIEKKHWG